MPASASDPAQMPIPADCLAREARLIAHPATPGGPITDIGVRCTVAPEGLSLVYRLAGDLDRLAIPPAALPAAADRLWEHTCCEAFVAGGPGTGYREFNFAPSGQWAIYDFADYRRTAGSAPAGTLAIDCQHTTSALTLTVTLPWALVPATPEHGLNLGLSCVIEDRTGQHCYWALAHPAARPDFHHRDAFLLHLPAARPA